MPVNEQLTLIAIEMPGLIVGNTDEPPERIMLVNNQGQVLWENTTLKMPYDIAPTPKGMTKNGLFATFSGVIRSNALPAGLALCET